MQGWKTFWKVISESLSIFTQLKWYCWSATHQSGSIFEPKYDFFTIAWKGKELPKNSQVWYLACIIVCALFVWLKMVQFSLCKQSHLMTGTFLSRSFDNESRWFWEVIIARKCAFKPEKSQSSISSNLSLVIHLHIFYNNVNKCVKKKIS